VALVVGGRLRRRGGPVCIRDGPHAIDRTTCEGGGLRSANGGRDQDRSRRQPRCDGTGVGRSASAADVGHLAARELTHIRRYDLVAQALGQVACCLYWFHPLAWMAASRLRKERELACDDVVLAAGVPPHEYAADLVDLARGLAGRRRAWVSAPAMAGLATWSRAFVPSSTGPATAGPWPEGLRGP
jgi:hypothetical protein